MIIEVKLGDITTEVVDVIVNAANTSLQGGHGVDGAIHKAAGWDLLKECLQFPVIDSHDNRCKKGEVKATNAYDLQAKRVYHTVGPYCADAEGASDRRKTTLYNCWKKCLQLAEFEKHQSIAFPSISTGVYKFPVGAAAEIASKAIKDFEKENPNSTLQNVRVITFTKEDYDVYYNVFFGSDKMFAFYNDALFGLKSSSPVKVVVDSDDGLTPI